MFVTHKVNKEEQRFLVVFTHKQESPLGQYKSWVALVEVVVWMLVHPSLTATLDIHALDENWASLQADEFMMITQFNL